MKFKNIPACLTALLVLSSCCNEKNMKLRLSRELDKSNIQGAISLIENSCLSEVPEIGVTKAMLLCKLAIDENNKFTKKKIMKEAIDILVFESQKGSEAARIILDEYNREGEDFFRRFPWGDLLGEGYRQDQRPLPEYRH